MVANAVPLSRRRQHSAEVMSLTSAFAPAADDVPTTALFPSAVQVSNWCPVSHIHPRLLSVAGAPHHLAGNPSSAYLNASMKVSPSETASGSTLPVPPP